MITKRRTPYLFLLPYLILFTVFIIIPTTPCKRPGSWA